MIIVEMKVHLHSDVFDIVKAGDKNVEARLYDEKRKQLNVGDTLVFLRRPLEEEKIFAKVTKLVRYKTFEELVEHYEMKRLYLDGYTKEMYLNEMSRFYTMEEQLIDGVLAIHFEVLNDEA